jgi:DNA-directed RNA polymerase specialized sigma54-like protein
MQPVDETIQNLQQILISNYENSVQPKNRQAIAAEYGIHVSTLRKLIKNKCPEIASRAALLPADILLLYSRLGIPPYLKTDQD